ncbi:MAG TPA: hypothetical protein VLF89_10040 [Candidatus Saccharimonadales bacterium]|nr:hypothetical protein [Candidatus Saccharimonadales bacterium]
MIVLVANDWPFFWKEAISYLTHFPSGWDSYLNNGLGMPSFGTLGIDTYLGFTAWISSLGIPWNIVSIIFWFIPPWIITFFSARYLYKALFPTVPLSFLAGLIYIFNTYFLMTFGGGQLGILFSYSFAPFVLARFIKTLPYEENQSSHLILLRNSLFAGLLASLQVIFDPRIAYITFLMVVLYYLFVIMKDFQMKSIKLIFIYGIVIPFISIFVLDLFWILPLIVYRQNPVEQLGSAYNSLQAVRFFSFAQFENSFSLLQANWPTNIFGKVSFMKPEFLFIPFMSFSVLLFIESSKLLQRKTKFFILLFAFLALIGSFLGKGANPPFGELYLFLFSHIPGFYMFRDPMKFYSVISLAYAVLIPLGIVLWSEFITYHVKKKNIPWQKILLLFVVIYMVVLYRPLWMGQLSGLFKPYELPSEYIQLKNYISKDPDFYRTLWVPSLQKFFYNSPQHPALNAYGLYKTNSLSEVVKILSDPGSYNLLKELGVRYIIVPYDSLGTIFIRDNTYDPTMYQNTVHSLDQIPALKAKKRIGKIVIYETQQYYSQFLIPGSLSKITYTRMNPTEYILHFENVKKGDQVVFSQNFDKNWMMKTNDISQPARIYNNRLNSFTIQRDGDYTATVYYQPQQIINIGLFISCISFILWIIMIIALKSNKKKT